MAKDKHAKIDLHGYYHAEHVTTILRIPQEPSRNDKEFWAENGGLDAFRQVGWISMNTKQVWGLDEEPPKDVPDMTPLYINVRGD